MAGYWPREWKLTWLSPHQDGLLAELELPLDRSLGFGDPVVLCFYDDQREPARQLARQPVYLGGLSSVIDQQGQGMFASYGEFVQEVQTSGGATLRVGLAGELWLRKETA